MKTIVQINKILVLANTTLSTSMTRNTITLLEVTQSSQAKSQTVKMQKLITYDLDQANMILKH
jgi:hypothetical protein